MTRRIACAVAGAVLVAASGAAAETVGIAASTKGSLYDRLGTVVAKVATNNGGLNATLRNYTSPNVYIPALNNGQVEFGLANEFELSIAVKGERFYKGRPHPNIRAIAILLPLRNGMFVRADSPIKTMADLKGKRTPDGYAAQKILLTLIDAHLETAGLTRKDMVSVPVASVVAGANAFIAGKTDCFLFALGAPKVREAHAKLKIRALPIPNTPEALAAIRKHMPVAYLRHEVPGKNNPGVTAPMWAMTYDALLFSQKGTSDEAAYKMTKALYENKKALAAASPLFRLFDQKRMAKVIPGVSYHPGAIKFYKEKGLWPPKQ
jgi:TRAP transporter TAXI family solute receptor